MSRNAMELIRQAASRKGSAVRRIETNWSRAEIRSNAMETRSKAPHRNELEKNRKERRRPGDEQQCYGYAEQRDDKKRNGTDPLRDEPEENSSAQE